MLQLGVTKTLEAQKNFWSLYPTVINFTAGGATSTLPGTLYLGWGSSDHDVYVMNTNLGTLSEITLSGPIFYQQITGVEFHTVVESGTSLYASMSGSGVFEIEDFTTSTPTITAIPSSRYLGTSQLELALDGLIYCVESQNGRLSTIDPLSHTINTLTTTVASSEDLIFVENWALPQQIDGEGDAFFYGVDPPAISGLNIEMTALPLVVSGAPTFFNCNPLGLDYTATGTFDDVSIEIVSVDPATGTPFMGPGFLNYATSLPSPVTLPLDLRCLDDAINCDLFDDFLGQTFKITVILKGEDCGTEASTQGFFKVFGAPTPISVDFKMRPPMFGQPLCQSSTVSTACVVGNQGVSFDATNTTGDITYYRINIREVDCTTGAPVGSPLLLGSNVNIASIAGLYGNLNTLVINGSPAYFADNPSLVDGKCFKIQLVLGNICDEYSATNFFFVDPNEYLQSNDPDRAATANAQKDKRYTEEIPGQPFFYPNPFTQDFSLQFAGKHDSEYALRLVNLNGQTIHQQQGKLTEGAVDIITPNDLPSGVYFYLLQLDADQPYAGRIVKQ